ncbi:hypothetical protein, partial [Escherichia coli]
NKSAEARFKALHRIDPNNPAVIAGLARVYHQQKFWSKVILFLSSVEQEFLDTEDARLCLSAAYLEVGQIEQASRILGA